MTPFVVPDEPAGVARLERFAGRLAQAWREGVATAVEAESLALSSDQAYAVQDLVAARMAWFPSGRPRAWKVGGPSRSVTPTAAPLPDRGLLASPARIAWGSLPRLGIEAEIAVRLGPSIDDLAATAANAADAPDALQLATLPGAIAGIGVAIEVVDTRLAPSEPAPPACKLADQQSHGALVLGPMQDHVARSRSDWLAQACVVTIDGREAARTLGSHPCGDPLWALGWLLRHAARRGMALRAGDVVTTGAWTGIHPVQATQRVVVSFPGVGEAVLHFGS